MTTFLFAFLPRKAVLAAFSLAELAAVGLVAAALLVRVAGAAGIAFVAAAARVPRFGLTTVVPVESADDSDVLVWFDDWLVVRCGDPMAVYGRLGGSILPRVLAAAGFTGDVFSLDAVRLSFPAAAAVPRLVDSIIPCMEAEIALVAADAAVLNGEAGLRGETGRENAAFMGDICLMGDCGRVRELCERGERTLTGFPARDVARGGAPAFARVFFATGRVSGAKTSLSGSAAICMWDDFLFLPLNGDFGDCCRMGDAALNCSCGRGGSGRSLATACSFCSLIEAMGLGFSASTCCARSSPMVIFRIAIGMRLTRR